MVPGYVPQRQEASRFLINFFEHGLIRLTSLMSAKARVNHIQQMKPADFVLTFVNNLSGDKPAGQEVLSFFTARKASGNEQKSNPEYAKLGMAFTGPVTFAWRQNPLILRTVVCLAW